MQFKRLVPNAFTMLNLLSGCVAIVMVTKLKYDLAFYFVALGIFFDFFDGFFARKFKVAGPLGVQLDSLADMVTSGVVPGFVMYSLFSDPYVFGENSLLPYIGFVITLGACYRLAKFNIDTRQSDSFIGLPTPANSLFFTSIPLLDFSDTFLAFLHNLITPWTYVVLCLLSAWVMNAEIPLFSLKIKEFSFSKYRLQIIFLLVSVAMLVLLKINAVPLIILMYVLSSVFILFTRKKS